MNPRYERQILMIGEEGQARLRSSTALVVGVGGLGSPVAHYLVAAGVGRVHLVDPGYLEVSNLNRQVLYTSEDIGRAKALAAAEKLSRLNPEVEVIPHTISVGSPEFEELVKEADVVVDCLDNWPAREVLNRLAVKHRKPLVHAGVARWYGQATTVIPGRTACLACIYPKGMRSETPIPVIGPTPGVLGAVEAAEAIRVLIGEEPGLAGKLLIMDLSAGAFEVVKVRRRPDCPVCGGLGFGE